MLMKILLPLLLSCALLVSACSSSDNSSTDSGAADPTTDAPATGPTGGVPDSSPVVGEAAEPPAPIDPTSTTTSPPTGMPSPEPVDDAASEPAPGTDSTTATEAGSASDSTATGAPATMPPPDDEIVSDPIAPIQPGTLTAGDYDDQLNPWLYQQYSNNYLQNAGQQADIPRLNLSKRIAVAIRDSSDAPYAGATVALIDTQGNTLSKLVTPASGTTYLYEDLDGLGAEFTLKINDRLGDISIIRTISIDSIDEQRQLEFKLDTPSVANSQLDLQLVVDTTGSMGDELSYLQTELTSILNNIQNANPQVSIHAGLVVYRDIGDQYVVRSYPFTDNLADMQSALNGETFDGGGDYPEAMDQAMAEALTFQWREQSAKVSFLVADAPPHSDRVGATWASALAARSQQIHIVPLAASGVAEEAEYLMRSMAALTNSRYLFLTDDSGVGNPHNEPAVDCYIVTRLDGLIKRVINQVITGVRTEPASNEVIREVGNYDNGVCQPDQQQ